MTKRRISASIDPDLLSAAEAAVKRRCSSNFSAWMAELDITSTEHNAEKTEEMSDVAAL